MYFAHILTYLLACSHTYLLAYLQAAAEKFSAEVARTAVLARRRLEQLQAHMATRLQLKPFVP